MSKITSQLEQYWNTLYGYNDTELLNNFFKELNYLKNKITAYDSDPEWYKDAVVYSLYVDLFNHDFKGLLDKLDYISKLGANCLWLLPILDSPMRDAGFDIKNYQKIRPELIGNSHLKDEEQHEFFVHFLSKAKEKGIRVIFDIAINHTSDQHPWFLESKKSINNPYRDFYIWNNDDQKYKEARLLFKGMCPSNWEKIGDWYFFHRFFEFQPDLNYRNPHVLLEMTKNLIFWLQQGVDGFRADAIPYLWKEEGTSCENLPNTHVIVKFFRAVLDYLKPGTLLLAEACQKPYEVVKYFGNSDECHAGYHFPLMPQMFKSIGKQSPAPIVKTLSPEVTPDIPKECQWFTFLRCHDELSLELVYVSEDDRKYIHEKYCKKPDWDFRLGEGISARLSELMDRNPQKIALAYSIMLSLPGTPVIYYGDEFGKLNDEDYYREQIQLTGKNDTRFLVRGRINWEQLERNLSDANNFHSQVFEKISKLIQTRNQFKNFGRGSLQWYKQEPKEQVANHVLAFYRNFGNSSILIISNLSEKEISVNINDDNIKNISTDMLGQAIKSDENRLVLPPLHYYWIKIH